MRRRDSTGEERGRARESIKVEWLNQKGRVGQVVVEGRSEPPAQPFLDSSTQTATARLTARHDSEPPWMSTFPIRRCWRVVSPLRTLQANDWPDSRSLPVHDAHCHPTTTTADLASEMSALRIGSLCAMSSTDEDQDFVDALARSRANQAGTRVFPCFGKSVIKFKLETETDCRPARLPSLVHSSDHAPARGAISLRALLLLVPRP